MKSNYSKFISVTLALVAMLAVAFLPPQQVYASELTLDAVFSEGSVSGTSWYGAGVITSGDWQDDSYRTGIDFDTTSIPDGAIITKVELGLTITDEAGTVPNDIAKMTATANSYYIANNYSGHHSDVDGNEYLSNSSAWVGTSTQTFVELLAAARTDLKAQLGDNWFSVGYTQTVDETANDEYRDGNDYQGDPPPQLKVTYTVPTWESYNDAAHQNVWGGVGTEYDSTYDMVYMYGNGFELSQLYHIGFYDPSASPNKVATDSSNATATGDLSAQYLLTTDPAAEAGTWHAVVYKDPNTPPTDYTADDPNSVVEDDFEVTPEALPEFPTVISAIAVAALCFGAYYWMRKRRLAYAKA